VRLLALILAGPTIWAIAFTLVYALHGAGCELGWARIELGFISLHRVTMLVAWLVGIAAGAYLLVKLPTGEGRSYWIPRATAWTGLAATVFTLFPVAVTSTCTILASAAFP
jgi:hypothetical protein